MAKFITTTEISYSIEKMIKGANDFIFIVSPYLKIHQRLKAVIEEKLSETNDYFQIIFVCKESELQYKNPDELKWLKSQPKSKFYNSNNLHAKSYLNEEQAIITSMNLYDYSQVNNIEFGLVIEKNDEQYNQIVKEVLKLSSKNLIKEIQQKKKKATDEQFMLDNKLKTEYQLTDAQVAAMNEW